MRAMRDESKLPDDVRKMAFRSTAAKRRPPCHPEAATITDPLGDGDKLVGCVLPTELGLVPAARPLAMLGSAGCNESHTHQQSLRFGHEGSRAGHDLIKAGSAAIVVAGGMESMSNAPRIRPKILPGVINALCITKADVIAHDIGNTARSVRRAIQG